MLCVLMFVILVPVSGNALSTYETAKNFSRPRLTSATNVPESELNSVASIAYLYTVNQNTNEWLGNGIIISKYYVVTIVDLSSYTLNGLSTTIRLKANCLDINNCNAGVIRPVFNIEPSPACETNLPYNNPLACIYLLRVCPSFPELLYASSTIFSLHAYRSPGSLVNMYQYDATGLLQKASKPIGEFCECSDLPNFDINYHLCLANNPYVYGEFSDQGKGVIIAGTSGEYIGFLATIEIFEGEIVLSPFGSDKLRIWLATSADDGQWEY